MKEVLLENYVISAGHSRKLGATIEEDGVNFAVWCPAAAVMELLLFKDADDDNPSVIPLMSPIFRSVYYWHVKVKNIGAGQIYAWRVKEAIRIYSAGSHTVETGKVLIDPYGMRIVFPKAYRRFQGNDPKENLKIAAKSAVIDIDSYDWGLGTRPHHTLDKTVIYEMHVKGFTADPSSGLSADLRGTYRGLIAKIPYLKSLGITAVELLPVFQYDKEDALPGKQNYWGYCPMGFFSVHEDYAQDRSLMGPLNEFRDMVRELHRNDIEVILDVVYNHTSEGDKHGPVYCFKGFDKDNYYIIGKDGQYGNYSGCGNTFNATRPIVRRLILDSLVFWKEKMHIDGFRFDLASILARDEHGMPIPNSPTLLDIDASYRLAETKIIAEPWDAGGLYQLGSIAGSKWREWNGQFRDDVRSFMRGDCGMIKRFVSRILGSPDIYNEREVDPQKSINFVTCHDGMTLWDLVTYSEKHNLANGENNRDGANSNYSANYGFEGEIDDDALNRLRLRQAKNFMALTILSMGTPMITMGDEILRTQKGNNNAYCQDNELSYMHWDLTPRQQEMLNFSRSLIKRRTMRTLGDVHLPLRMMDNALRSTKLQWHGVKPFQPDWSDSSHSVGVMVFWSAYSVYAYIFVNAYWEDLTVELPPTPHRSRHHWFQVVDTSKAPPHDASHDSAFGFTRLLPSSKIKVKARSIIMLFSPE